MGVRTIVCFTLLSCASFLQAQTAGDTLNQYNDRHKKQGYWKVYLTDYLITTEDSAKACYYAYDYYWNGKLIIWASSAQHHKKKALRIERDLPLPQAGKPQAISGGFRFYYKYGLGLEEKYEAGLTVMAATVYTNSDGQLVKTEVLDFSKRYENKTGTFLYERFDMGGKLTYSKWWNYNEKGKIIELSTGK